jgi:hypothetical protein
VRRFHDTDHLYLLGIERLAAIIPAVHSVTLV